MDAIATLVAADVLEGLPGALTAAQLDSVQPTALRANFAHGDLVAAKFVKLPAAIKADPLITARVNFIQQAAHRGITHQVVYVLPKARVTIPSDAGAKVDFFLRKFFNDPTSGVTSMPRIP